MRKNSNKKEVFNYIYSNPGTTKQALQMNLNLSLPTINSCISQLMDDNLIIHSGMEKNTGGRNSKEYSINQQLRYSIGIDITKNHISLVLINLSSEIVDYIRVKKKFSNTESYFIQLRELIKTILEKNKVELNNVLECGIGLPALTNITNDKVVYGEILGIKSLEVKEIENYLGLPCKLYNDANAAGFGETWNYPPTNTTFYLMLSNNVGGCVLSHGEPYYGNTLKSGEVGHLRLHSDGKQCYCGQRGCVDQYLASKQLSRFTDGNLEVFFDELPENQEFRTIFDAYVIDLVETLNAIRMVLDCDIILGGYVGSHLEPYLHTIQEKLDQRNSFGDKSDYIFLCNQRKESIAVGAALPSILSFIEEI